MIPLYGAAPHQRGRSGEGCMVDPEKGRDRGEVVIERDAQPVAVIRPAEPVRRKISECIALMPVDSTATIDPDFAKDVEAAIAAHREPLQPPAWD